MKNSLLFVLMAVALIAGCGKEARQAASREAADPSVVAVSPALLATLKIGKVVMQPVAETLRVAGQIDFDEQRLARIGTTVSGRVMRIDVQLGQVVQRGDVLARLNSSELSSQQLAYLKARSQLELNQRNAERAKALFEADVIAAAELQRRQSEYQISLAEAHAAADQLELLGVSRAAIERLGKKGDIDSVTPVVATQAGAVVERHLAAGQVVQPADALFVIADLSRVWAVAQVPEQQVALVQPGQTVTIEVPALGDETLAGKLIYVGQTVNPETRTVLVRTELDNRDGRLKPAMLASMLIEAQPVKRLVVPAAAVVRENDEDYVFVAEGEASFRLIKVRLGPEKGGIRVVQSGLKGDEKLVIDGAFHLNNERNRQEMEGA